MSQTEIYIYKKSRKSEILVGTVPNAWAGSIAVWDALSKKYINNDLCMFNTGHIEKVWALYKDARLTRNERIVLTATFDNSSCKPEHINEVITALRDVNHSLLNDKGNLNFQADIIEHAIKKYKNIYCFVLFISSITPFCDSYTTKENTYDIIDDVNETEKTFAIN